VSLVFRWLGVAGVELKSGGQVIAIDPFFTRPSLASLIKPVTPNAWLVAEKLPACDIVLVTHAHWDHMMDVPQVVHQTGAIAYGSANTCQLLILLGVKESQMKEVHPGEKLSTGEFVVEVIHGQHSPIPFGRVFNGKLRQGLKPPLRLQDYRMDDCLGFRITVMGIRTLICAAGPMPAELLFIVAQEPRDYYQRMFQGVQPHTVVPIHWDNFMRPLNKSQYRFTRPGRMNLSHLTEMAYQILPQAKVLIPKLFYEYTFNSMSLLSPGVKDMMC